MHKGAHILEDAIALIYCTKILLQTKVLVYRKSSILICIAVTLRYLEVLIYRKTKMLIYKRSRILIYSIGKNANICGGTNKKKSKNAII